LPCQVNQKTMADLLRSYLCAVPSSVLWGAEEEAGRKTISFLPSIHWEY
jgi:hypothetical protein